MISHKNRSSIFLLSELFGVTQSQGRMMNVTLPVWHQNNAVTLVLKAFPRVPTCSLCMQTREPGYRLLCNDCERSQLHAWSTGKSSQLTKNVLAYLERQVRRMKVTLICFHVGAFCSPEALYSQVEDVLPPGYITKSLICQNILHCQILRQIRWYPDFCQLSASLADAPVY